jgi:copper oxidase (laccase) domain-containing protein
VDVDDSGLCTACHPSRFFSYRRDGATGRQAAIAVKH